MKKKKCHSCRCGTLGLLAQEGGGDTSGIVVPAELVAIWADENPENADWEARAGVTFSDGTTEKMLSEEDFDENGVVRVLFLRSANASSSVCHTIDYLDSGGNAL